MKHTNRELEAAHRLSEALLSFVLTFAEAQAARRRAVEAEARSREQEVRRGGFGGLQPVHGDKEEAPVRLLLSVREAAEALQISPRTLWAITAPRGPLPVVRIGSAVRYPIKDLEHAVQSLKKTASKLGDDT